MAAGHVVSGLRGEVISAVGALMFGVFLVFTAGFAGASVLHEAAHNTRHSIAFPCH
ncbi:MAG: CbtB-domain containing protein [Alphaproteobacteria bacterium]|nr:CbtB-domain containing protein [Alphaproteobacteria bacterium]